MVNILAAGNVPTSVSKFFAVGCLIALNKNKEGCPPDIRPIAVGEIIRRLTGKYICALVKDKAAELFQPLQLGVACHAGAEKVAHAHIEEHWMDEDLLCLRWTCGMPLILSPGKQSLMSVLHFSLSYYLGFLGAMGPILCYGTLLARSALSLECSKVTL